MQTRLVTLTLIAGLTIAPEIAGAEPNGRHRGSAKVDFIGVFHPVFTGGRLDPARCPDRSHPLLFTFRGEAFTTLGHATFEQSHCEAPDHSSFRRGRQTITFDSGDVLYGAYRGDLLATPTTAMDGRLIIDGTYRNMGGTGALSDAHGGGISAGFVDTANGSAEVTVSGRL